MVAMRNEVVNTLSNATVSANVDVVWPDVEVRSKKNSHCLYVKDTARNVVKFLPSRGDSKFKLRDLLPSEVDDCAKAFKQHGP
jgi:hypothetical protein